MQMDKPKSTLLLIEDDVDDAYFFRRALQLSGEHFVVHHSPNAYAAMDFLQTAARTQMLPKMVVLDLKLPILNGFDVLEWLQKQPFAPQITVAVLSGSGRLEDRMRALGLGAEEYMVKPVSVDHLRRSLKGLVPTGVRLPSESQGEET